MLDNNDIVGRNVVVSEKLNWEVILDSLFRFNEKVYIFVDLLLRYKLLQTFYNISAANYQEVFKIIRRIVYCYFWLGFRYDIKKYIRTYILY